MTELITPENEVEEVVAELERDQRIGKYDIDDEDHTQYELPADAFSDTDLKEYADVMNSVTSIVAEFAGEEGESHYLTVDTDGLEDYF
jgi:hypothetical protein